MAEVIAFLIQHFKDFDDCPQADDLGQILEDVGFNDVEIGGVLTLLDALSHRDECVVKTTYHDNVMRVYIAEELELLSQEVLGLLHFLEKSQVINGEQREFIVQALLNMPADDITLDAAKILTLLVLWVYKAELPVLIGDELMMALYGNSTMH